MQCKITINLPATPSSVSTSGSLAIATGLSYLNARYYNSAQGQFLSEDPVFLGNPSRQNLANPQSLNSYSYANDNPINISDPNGLLGIQSVPRALVGALKSLASALQGLISTLQNPVSTAVSIGSGAYNAGSHPITTTQNAARSTYNYIQTFRNASDYNQGQMIGSGVVTIGSMFATDGLGDAGEAAQLVARARQIHGVLDPIAQSMRTTAVLRTAAGDIVAGGGKDLTTAQIGSLLPGEIAANAMPGAHAEVTAITQALNSGSTPEMIGASRAICRHCAQTAQIVGTPSISEDCLLASIRGSMCLTRHRPQYIRSTLRA